MYMYLCVVVRVMQYTKYFQYYFVDNIRFSHDKFYHVNGHDMLVYLAGQDLLAQLLLQSKYG